MPHASLALGIGRALNVEIFYIYEKLHNMYASVFVYKHTHAHMYIWGTIHQLLNFPFMDIK